MITNGYSLFTVIINKGKASRILKESKKLGVTGGTIVYGYGTVDSDLLHFLEIYEVEKEVLFMVIKDSLEALLHQELEARFKLDRQNKGIAFSMPLTRLVGTRSCSPVKKDSDLMGYEAIFVVVDKNKGEEVVDRAKEYGAKGATIIHGRGSGIHEKAMIFDIVIEPEKEIVLLLIKKDRSQEVIQGIEEDLRIKEPGQGILFAMDVNHATGLME